MKRIRDLDVNATDKVYEMPSGRLLKVRVVKKEVLEKDVSFTIRCSEVDKKGKALVISKKGEELSHALAPPWVVNIPIDSKEHPIDVIKREVEGHTFTKNNKKTIIKGRLEKDDKYFANLKTLNNTDKEWQDQ